MENFSVPALLHQSPVVDATAPALPTDADYDAAQLPLRSSISKEHLPQLAAVVALFERAGANKTIPLRQLRTALTVEQYQQFTERCGEILDPVEVMYGSGRPEALDRYVALVRDADFACVRYQSAKSAATRSREYARSERLYELALEHLEELYSTATSNRSAVITPAELDAWLDRTVDFERGAERTVGIEPQTIPRVRGSRSHQAQDSALPKLSKRIKQEICALNALVEAGCAIAFDIPAPPKSNTAKLKERTQKMHRLQQQINWERD